MPIHKPVAVTTPAAADNPSRRDPVLATQQTAKVLGPGVIATARCNPETRNIFDKRSISQIPPDHSILNKITIIDIFIICAIFGTCTKMAKNAPLRPTRPGDYLLA
ncbi:hypothetical protein [Paracoccus shandongensis]|uniref:hypothetical protein n=1 Tax=Paracoccus shandongensis TaxID=2816048 RepID=UPI001F1C1C3B|nr:hypothetical protein [Paracoccus shandongensis]